MWSVFGKERWEAMPDGIEEMRAKYANFPTKEEQRELFLKFLKERRDGKA